MSLLVPSAEYAGLNERMPGNDRRATQGMSAAAIVTNVLLVPKSLVGTVMPQEIVATSMRGRCEDETG